MKKTEWVKIKKLVVTLDEEHITVEQYALKEKNMVLETIKREQPIRGNETILVNAYTTGPKSIENAIERESYVTHVESMILQKEFVLKEKLKVSGLLNRILKDPSVVYDIKALEDMGGRRIRTVE